MKLSLRNGVAISRPKLLAVPYPGANSSFTFTEPGTYPYFCERHQSMRGEVQVK